MARLSIRLAVVVFLAATIAGAQVLIGSYPEVADVTFGSGPAQTFIDSGHPAVANGTVNYVTLHWNATHLCSASMKIKILHPTGAPGAYTETERGPFDTVGGRFTVHLTPGIPVAEGDLLAVTQLLTLQTCGSVSFTPADASNSVQMQDGDFHPPMSSTGLVQGYSMAAIGTAGPTALSGILPVAGAAAGSLGSFFRTSVQLINPEQQQLSGHLIFHPQGKPAAATDPSLAFTVPGPGTLSYPDLVTSMGQTGVGSIDIVSDGGVMPTVNARIFNDNGAAGTLGFNEEALPAGRSMHPFQQGLLVMPADPAHFRMNIGVRSLTAAHIAFVVYSSAGNLAAPPVAYDYPANYFEQKPATAVLNVPSLTANAYVVVSIESGSAVVYASYTDNRTNDSSIKYAGR